MMMMMMMLVVVVMMLKVFHLQESILAVQQHRITQERFTRGLVCPAPMPLSSGSRKQSWLAPFRCNKPRLTILKCHDQPWEQLVTDPLDVRTPGCKTSRGAWHSTNVLHDFLICECTSSRVNRRMDIQT